ncbi:MAG: hypothetical protein ACREV5_18095 [Steroidobacter sp.]
MNKNLWCIVTACSALLLAGCGGLSDVGKQEDEGAPPTAVVTVIGQPSTVAGDKVTIAMRAGGELFLSGKDSTETVLPILKFDWQRRNAAADQLKIVQRNSSSIAFQIPQVAQPTTFELRLVVTDSDGETDLQDVDVIVDPVTDPNQFLSYLGAPATFDVVAVTSQDLPPCAAPGQQNCLSADAPFLIEVETRAHYWDIGGRFNEGADGPTQGVVVDARSFSGSWLSTLGASMDCNAIENPRFTVPIPALDADDIAAAVQSSGPTRVLDLSRVGEAQLVVTVRISQPAGAVALPVGSTQVCAPAFSAFQASVAATGARTKSTLRPQLAPDGAATQIQFTTDELLDVLVDVQPDSGGAVVQDTRRTAEAYYATIDDPEDAANRRTFIGWLKANGFLPPTHGDAIDWAAVAAGSEAHALYVNDFDLGFGRDMYARKLGCEPNAGPSFEPGECDIATVVVNYGSLEAAAKKLGPQLAVAMEYSRKGDAGPRFVKFYTYAPDIRCDPANPPQGGCTQFRQVMSANLDGRGEKFMPGACTVCHGGTPLGLDGSDPPQYASRDVNSVGGDVNAAFLPWDLKSFLFSDDAQAGFPDDPGNTAHHDLWLQTRRSEQASHIKLLNQLAAMTYVDPADQANRYEIPRQLVQGWYSGQGGTFNENFVPPQWDADASQRSLYLDVFAQYCRTCHISHTPNVASVGIAGLDPYQKCDATSAAAGYAGSNRQIAFGCYHQFVNAGGSRQRLAQGAMPAARLTMDRFWVSESKPAGESLAEHLNMAAPDLKPALRPDIIEADVRLAGSSTIGVQSFDAVTGDLGVLRRNSVVRPRGILEGGVGAISWSIQTPSGAPASVAGGSGLSPAFFVATPGQYTVGLTAGGVTVNRTVTLPNFLPAAAALSRTVAPATASVTIDVLASSNIMREGADATLQPLVQQNPASFNGDPPYTLSVCAAPTPAAECTGTSYQTALGAQVTVEHAALSPARSVLSYTVSDAGSDQFAYRITDVDGDWSMGSVSVAVTAALVATSQTVCVQSLGQESFDLDVTGGAEPFSVTFADALGLAPTGDTGLTWFFEASLMPGSASQPVFWGDTIRPYDVADTSTPEQESDATLTVRVLPKEPWSRSLEAPTGSPTNGVSSLWGTLGCTGCHFPGGSGQNFRLDDAATLYANVSGRADPTNPADSRILVCPTRQSGFTCLGLDSVNHPTTNLAVDDDNYDAILRWIEEGASDNTDDQTGCPP